MNALTEAQASAPIADLKSDSLIQQFPEGPRLVGTQCSSCATAMLGTRAVCSSCVCTDVFRIALPETGSLYSFTRLHVGGDVARALGYVDLGGVEVRTLADLNEIEKPLLPDMPVRLVVEDDAWYFTPISGN